MRFKLRHFGPSSLSSQLVQNSAMQKHTGATVFKQKIICNLDIDFIFYKNGHISHWIQIEIYVYTLAYIQPGTYSRNLW